MRYNPALDGVRAFAIVIVMLFHARAPVSLGGYVGVDVFFVLSGFLITSLLLVEVEVTGRVDLPGFWRRRLWRLTPALAAMIISYLLAAPMFWPGADHLKQALLAALYLSDYGVAFWGTAGQISHTWSLAVEMHFYLLWPLVLWAAWRRWKGASLPMVLAVGWLLATFLRWFWIVKGQSWEQVYYRFDTRLSGLMLGGWVAAALQDPRWREAVRRMQAWLLWLPVAAIGCLRYPWHDLWMPVWGLPIVEWATAAVLIAVQAPRSQLSMMLSLPVLVWLGRLSYGLYLWHYPIFVYLRARYPWDEVLAMGVPFSLALAAASYFTVERWATRRRRRPPQAAALSNMQPSRF